MHSILRPALRRPLVRSLATTASKADGASLASVARSAASAPAPSKPAAVPPPAAAKKKSSSAPSPPRPASPPTPVLEMPAAAAVPEPALRVAPPQRAARPTTSELREFAPKISVIGVGGAGGNAVNNMIARGLAGVDFAVCNTDAQHLATCLTDNCVQLGVGVTDGLGCGANPDAGRAAAEESHDEILELVGDSHMVFITAGMGGGTGTGAAPVIAQACIDAGVLTVAVVTKPFRFEGLHRMRLASEGIKRMEAAVDTLIVVPNQNLFQMVDAKTPLVEAFGIADDVLLAGVKSVTDLMVMPGMINLDFADVNSVMQGMGNAIMGTGVASGEDRALRAAEDALRNPLLGDLSVATAKGMLVNITGGPDMTLFEVDQAAQRITEEVDDQGANIIFGSAFDPSLDGSLRVSVVATGIDEAEGAAAAPPQQ